MQKKNLIIVFLFVLIVGLFVYPRVIQTNTAEAVGISEVSANPQQYLGKLTLSGIVGDVYPDDGVFVMVDGGGCCQIPALVPFNAEQQELLEMDTLYTGSLPATGDLVETKGTLLFEDGYYMYDVDTVTRNGQTIISKVK
jgi:hypothetical protein